MWGAFRDVNGFTAGLRVLSALLVDFSLDSHNFAKLCRGVHSFMILSIKMGCCRADPSRLPYRVLLSRGGVESDSGREIFHDDVYPPSVCLVCLGYLKMRRVTGRVLQIPQEGNTRHLLRNGSWKGIPTFIYSNLKPKQVGNNVL